MIHKDGDLFDSDALYLAQGVNCVGAMGAGIARRFKQEFPAMYRNYTGVCYRAELQPGGIHAWPETWNGQQIMVVNLATQETTGPNADYDWLANAALDMAYTVMREDNVAKFGNRVAIPEIGCGIGGLEWPVVEEILLKIEEVTGIEFEVWHYKEEK